MQLAENPDAVRVILPEQERHIRPGFPPVLELLDGQFGPGRQPGLELIGLFLGYRAFVDQLLE
jgi:hypothetical protein